MAQPFSGIVKDTGRTLITLTSQSSLITSIFASTAYGVLFVQLQYKISELSWFGGPYDPEMPDDIVGTYAYIRKDGNSRLRQRRVSYIHSDCPLSSKSLLSKLNHTNSSYCAFSVSHGSRSIFDTI